VNVEEEEVVQRSDGAEQIFMSKDFSFCANKNSVELRSGELIGMSTGHSAKSWQ
jgi:hypothetical protein